MIVFKSFSDGIHWFDLATEETVHFNFPQIWTPLCPIPVSQPKNKKTKEKATHNAEVFFKATIPLVNLHIKSMTTWIEDKVWLSFNLWHLKLSYFSSIPAQYVRSLWNIKYSLSVAIHITQYGKYLQKKKEEEKDIQWNKRTLLQSVLSRNYLDILEVRCCKKEKKKKIKNRFHRLEKIRNKWLLNCYWVTENW